MEKGGDLLRSKSDPIEEKLEDQSISYNILTSLNLIGFTGVTYEVFTDMMRTDDKNLEFIEHHISEVVNFGKQTIIFIRTTSDQSEEQLNVTKE